MIFSSKGAGHNLTRWSASAYEALQATSAQIKEQASHKRKTLARIHNALVAGDYYFPVRLCRRYLKYRYY